MVFNIRFNDGDGGLLFWATLYIYNVSKTGLINLVTTRSILKRFAKFVHSYKLNEICKTCCITIFTTP